MKVKSLLLILLFLFCSTDGSACDRWNRIQKDGVLIVGTPPGSPPFAELNEKGELVGFDIDLVHMLAQEMGLRVQLRTMRLDEVFSKVQDGSVDLAVSCLSITENRKKIYDFTNPYYRSGQVILVGSKARIYDVESLDGKIVYAQRGTTGAEMAEVIDGAKVRIVDDFTHIIGLMERGEQVALVADRALADYYKGKLGFMTVGQPLSYEEIAVMMAKGCPPLRVSLNEALYRLSEKGEIRKLRGKWKL